MSVEQGIRLRNGKINDSTAEASLTTFSTMAEANSVDTDSSENNDASSHFAEIREIMGGKSVTCNQSLVY